MSDLTPEQWISVDDRLPPKNTLVLAYLEGWRHHSDIEWQRSGFWLLPYHDPEGWPPPFCVMPRGATTRTF